MMESVVDMSWSSACKRKGDMLEVQLVHFAGKYKKIMMYVKDNSCNPSRSQHLKGEKKVRPSTKWSSDNMPLSIS